MKRYVHDIEIALEALLSNKLKSGLTALGILFGVAAVISMLAIGQGAKQEILKQIELIGANNIVVEARIENQASNSKEDNEEEQGDQKEKQRKFSPGLDLKDYEAIRSILPNIQHSSPEVIMESNLIYKGTSMEGNCIGVSNEYFDIYNFQLSGGSYFSPLQEQEGKRICVIGAEVASKLFSQDNPVGQYIKFGNIWLKVVGVLKNEAVSASAVQEYGFNRVNSSVYVPDKTMIMRIKNRKLLNFKPSASSQNAVVVINGAVYGGQSSDEKNNYHQLDRIVIKVAGTEHLGSTADVVRRMLTRRHNGMEDFEVIVPELLLRQKQQAKEIFNFVLGAIAGISLLVGGIGIMNIMFATVMERIKEIGIRMAIGANKKDILVQFMSEAVMISLTGGFIGIALGVGISRMIEQLTEIETLVTPGSILIAFLVSVTVGIIFGYSPAKRAAEKDPIESLRYE